MTTWSHLVSAKQRPFSPSPHSTMPLKTHGLVYQPSLNLLVVSHSALHYALINTWSHLFIKKQWHQQYRNFVPGYTNCNHSNTAFVFVAFWISFECSYVCSSSFSIMLSCAFYITVNICWVMRNLCILYYGQYLLGYEKSVTFVSDIKVGQISTSGTAIDMGFSYSDFKPEPVLKVETCVCLDMKPTAAEMHACMDMKPTSVAGRRAGRSTDIHIKSDQATNEDTDAETVSSSVTDTDRDTVSDFEPEPAGAASGGWKKCYDFSRLSSREKLLSPNRISSVSYTHLTLPTRRTV